MDTIEFDKAWVDGLTTIDVALQVYRKEEWLAVKQRLLGAEFDEEAQIKIWQDYHDLLGKAVLRKFEEGDIERLEKYRQLKGHFELISRWTEGRLHFPTDITRDDSGKIVRVTYKFFDNEITKRWFEHVYNVLVGREDVRKCSEESCSNFFARKRRKDKKFCSDICRIRAWRSKRRKKNA